MFNHIVVIESRGIQKLAPTLFICFLASKVKSLDFFITFLLAVWLQSDYIAEESEGLVTIFQTLHKIIVVAHIYRFIS